MAQAKKSTYPNFRRYLPFLVIALISFYVFIPQINNFQHSLRTILSADKAYLGWAALFFTLTYFAATASYCFITYFRLRFWPTFLVQIADGFTNRIIPAGFGAVATNALYLAEQTKSKDQASYIALLNNFMGFIAHMILLVVILVLSRTTPHGLLKVNPPKITVVWYLAALVILSSGFIFWRRIKKQTISSYKTSIEVLRLSLARPQKILLGLGAAMMVTILYALTLYSVMLALNVHLGILQAFLVLTVSVIAIAITPTPGGLGGVEAGLVAVMVSFGVSSGQALSVALVYRLITYWLPIIPGAIALEWAAKRGYVAEKLKF